MLSVERNQQENSDCFKGTFSVFNYRASGPQLHQSLSQNKWQMPCQIFHILSSVKQNFLMIYDYHVTATLPFTELLCNKYKISLYFIKRKEIQLFLWDYRWCRSSMTFRGLSNIPALLRSVKLAYGLYSSYGA